MARVPHRPPRPGAPYELSELVLSVAPYDRPLDAGTATTLLRRAWAEGITTYDLVDAPDVAAAETLLARAFPNPDPSLVVIGPPPSPARSAVAAVSAPPRASASWVAGPPGSVPTGWQPRRLIEVEAASWLGAEARPSVSPETPYVLGTAVRCRSAEETRGVLAAAGPRPAFLTGRISLLRRELVAANLLDDQREPLRWLARDPFAGGRLDGSWFEKELATLPSAGPRPVRELETEFGPIARLRFLVQPGRRTLAQAAIRYALGIPAVAWASVPIPRVERWEEILGYAGSPPLGEKEQAALAGFA